MNVGLFTPNVNVGAAAAATAMAGAAAGVVREAPLPFVSKVKDEETAVEEGRGGEKRKDQTRREPQM